MDLTFPLFASRTIPLAEVVDCKWPHPRTLFHAQQLRLLPLHAAFDVFLTGQGKEGLMGRASRQQLENAFGTHKDVDVVMQVRGARRGGSLGGEEEEGGRVFFLF